MGVQSSGVAVGCRKVSKGFRFRGGMAGVPESDEDVGTQ